jgi:hypothetical protein
MRRQVFAAFQDDPIVPGHLAIFTRFAATG